MWRARLALEPFDVATEQAAFEGALDRMAGAVTTFTGRARGLDHHGHEMNRLFLQHHPVLTQQSLDAIAAGAAERFAVQAVHVVHRAGSVAVGAPIVWVAVAAAHRRAAFEAVDYLMDRLKTEAMFWKREDGPAGSTWIEPTARDIQERTRWE